MNVVDRPVAVETRESVSCATSARDVATACCLGTPLRNEIDARDAGLLQLATDRATEAIAAHHGDGPQAGKIQAHVIVAAGERHPGLLISNRRRAIARQP
ncbi:hypothetical protein [Burkholderia pyrrocinia]|uniref:Uncharacterized protein n=1 Tax=Burkholderia pyrrocinia TaxID=60550 RepID=A0ABZ3BMA3_BURPY